MSNAPRPVDLLLPEAGRRPAINAGLCANPPFGCGKPVGQFRDNLSAREYHISGLCQTCQDDLFEDPWDDDDADPDDHRHNSAFCAKCGGDCVMPID